MDSPIATPCGSEFVVTRLSLGVVRNLPSGVAGAALDPVVVALVGDLQQDPKQE